MATSSARYVKSGEMLALASTRLHQDRKGFFWMLGSGSMPNERKGDAVVVHIRGELEHHTEAFSCAESYEGILAKMRAAYEGGAVDDGDDDEDDQPTTPPKAIVMVIDSPGGVVSGLNECVRELQRMRAEHPEIKVSCYVDEMATSAAYALACSCDEIICPPSAILGSIGVISTMISAAARDKKDGFDVRLLTSGARKADGHMHAPLSDDALEVEQGRVDKLALAFFKLASKARGLSVNKIRSFQAGIFLGRDAIRSGLADGSMSFADFLEGAQSTDPRAASGGNQTDRRLKSEKTMSIALSALIKKTEKKLASEKDPKKLAALTASLDAYKKTQKHIEHTETEEGEDEGEEEKGEEESEEEESEESAVEDEKKSKGMEDEKKSKKAPPGDDSDDDEDDDSDDEDDEDEEKSAKKALALVQRVTGMKGKKALGALQAIAMTAANAAADVAVLKRQAIGREKAALIAGAKGKYLTAKEASWLGGQKMSVVQGFVEMRRKSGVIVNTDESTLIRPKDAKPGTEESLPAETIKMINESVAAMRPEVREKNRAELVAAHLKSHSDQISRAMNGAAEGRY